MPRRCLVLSVFGCFGSALVPRQDSRLLYCLLSALFCNKVVACLSFVLAVANIVEVDDLNFQLTRGKHSIYTPSI
jgi:hypothetical protein